MSEEFVIGKGGRKMILPTPEEDRSIDYGIAADPDTFELSRCEIAELKPLGARVERVSKQ